MNNSIKIQVLLGGTTDLDYIKVGTVVSKPDFEKQYTIYSYCYQIKVTMIDDVTFLINHKENKYKVLNNEITNSFVDLDTHTRNVINVALYAYTYDDLSINIKSQIRSIMNTMIKQGIYNKSKRPQAIKQYFKVYFSDEIISNTELI
ncbi:hypothetical protein [Staphylococcus gallinarum]|uniref:hypothetical protein n=1 Tax=Staphylococcus gallinarum TaxID=1293 RepID=UPI0030C27D28